MPLSLLEPVNVVFFYVVVVVVFFWFVFRNSRTYTEIGETFQKPKTTLNSFGSNVCMFKACVVSVLCGYSDIIFNQREQRMTSPSQHSSPNAPLVFLF